MNHYQITIEALIKTIYRGFLDDLVMIIVPT